MSLCSLARKPAKGQPSWVLTVCFHKFQDKEKALQWSRTHDVQLGRNKLWIYPDFTANLEKDTQNLKTSNSCCISKREDSEWNSTSRHSSIPLKRPNSSTITGLLHINLLWRDKETKMMRIRLNSVA